MVALRNILAFIASSFLRANRLSFATAAAAATAATCASRGVPGVVADDWDKDDGEGVRDAGCGGGGGGGGTPEDDDNR